MEHFDQSQFIEMRIDMTSMKLKLRRDLHAADASVPDEHSKIAFEQVKKENGEYIENGSIETDYLISAISAL